jgi:hypothetical protein
MSQTRRLAAILAADVAGYSRLKGRMRKARSNASKRCAASSSIRKRGTIYVTAMPRHQRSVRVAAAPAKGRLQSASARGRCKAGSCVDAAPDAVQIEVEGGELDVGCTDFADPPDIKG